MTEEEIAYANAVTLNPCETLREQLKTLRVKEARIAKRLKKAKEDMENVGRDDRKIPAMVVLTGTQGKQADAEGRESTSLSTASETQEMHYLRLDAAHSMVLEQIRRVSDSLARMEGEGGEESRNGVAIVLDLDGGRRHEGDGN